MWNLPRIGNRSTSIFFFLRLCQGHDKHKEPKEEEPKTLTLDEWKAQQSQGKKGTPKFNVRKAGEGSDLVSSERFPPLVVGDGS